MKILFVTSETHVEGIGGGATHTRGILSLFEMIPGTEIHRLTLPLPLSRRSRRVQRLRAIALSLGSRLPSKAHFLLDSKVRPRLRAALARLAPDVVVFNSSDLLPLAGEVERDIPFILVSHNVETRIIERQAALVRIPGALRALADKDVEKTRRMEVDGAGRMRLVIAISNEDAHWYREHTRAPQVTVLPGTFGYAPYRGARPPVARPLRIAYLAKMTWWPNRQGAEAFLASVLPALPQDTVEVHFFGPGSEAFAGRHPALRAHGFVKRLDTVWSTVNLSMCPTLDGSGLNLKLAESLYNRVPVLATPHASRGLPQIDDPALVTLPLEEWPDFLRSDRAEALARESVRPETAERFSAEHASRELESLLQQLGTGASRNGGQAPRPDPERETS